MHATTLEGFAMFRRFITLSVVGLFLGLGVSLFNEMTVPVKAAKNVKTADAVPETTFTNASTITIPTVGNADLYPSPIVVSGMTGTVTSVTITFNNFSHTFPDDLGIVLVGPTGAALLVADGCGEDVVSGVTFTLADSGSTLLPDVDPWTAGTYKPAGYFTGDSFPAPGPLLAYSHPGPAGGNTATFASVFNGTAPNGTWNLFIKDFVAGDGGSVTGGWTLNVTTSAPSITPQHVVDLNGDGKTDYTLARNTGGGPGGALTWNTRLNGAAPGAFAGVAWGIQGDEFVPADYDGDSKTDISVWRPSNATWYTLRSATSTVNVQPFGVSTDDPSVVGDYDGDGKDDLAIYRAGASAGLASHWWYQRSSVGGVGCTASNCNDVTWGQNGDFPAPGDYDGDGKNDFVIQRNFGGGQAIFWELFATGTENHTNVFGTPTDVIVPGDYDGDGKTDLATVRGSGGQILWNIRRSSGGDITQSFGASATDFVSVGDYDGDGKTDLAVWRPDVTPANNAFWILGSTAGASFVQFGQNGDYPVANYNTH